MGSSNGTLPPSPSLGLPSLQRQASQLGRPRQLLASADASLLRRSMQTPHCDRTRPRKDSAPARLRRLRAILRGHPLAGRRLRQAPSPHQPVPHQYNRQDCSTKRSTQGSVGAAAKHTRAEATPRPPQAPLPHPFVAPAHLPNAAAPTLAPTAMGTVEELLLSLLGGGEGEGEGPGEGGGEGTGGGEAEQLGRELSCSWALVEASKNSGIWGTCGIGRAQFFSQKELLALFRRGRACAAESIGLDAHKASVLLLTKPHRP